MGVGDLPGPDKKALEAAQQKIHDEDVILAKTFSTPTGRKALEWLRDQYVDRPVTGYVVDKRGAINAAASTFQMWQREGQRIVVKDIEMRIKRSNERKTI